MKFNKTGKRKFDISLLCIFGKTFVENKNKFNYQTAKNLCIKIKIAFKILEARKNK